MKEKNYIVTKTKSGILVKRYFNKTLDKNGEPRVEFYYAERLNSLERGLYKIEGFLKGCNKQKYLKLKVGTAAILLAGLVFGGIAIGTNSKDNDRGIIYDDYSYSEKINLSQTPNVDIYKNKNGQDFLTLDSALEISRFNYAQIKNELENFNKSATEREKYNFDISKFDYTTFVGVQIRESSLKVNDPSDGQCKGCFKIGEAATAEANEVAIKLTGKPIITSEKDYNDPIKSSKACMYIYIKNYEYVYDNIIKNNLNAQVKPEMIIDEYLYGCGNINKEINGGGYTQKQYSKDIVEYANILVPYGKQLFENGLFNKEHSEEYNNIYVKLNKVTENKQNEK